MRPTRNGRSALLIGRFQPFHNGHLFLLSSLFHTYNTVIVGIGSSQYSHTCDNPFSFDERRQMVEQSLAAARLPSCRIVAIPDIHDPPHWVAHVASITGPFDDVITNNPETRRLFEEQGYRVVKSELHQRDLYCGHTIRALMAAEAAWDHLVPRAVAKVITDLDGIQRLKQCTHRP